MSIQTLAASIHASHLSAMVRGSVHGTDWVFPILETLHVMFLALFFGSLAMADLRLLGVGARKATFTAVYREVLGMTWWAFIGTAVVGSVMATGRIQDYLSCWQFLLKFGFLGLAGINMLLFHFGTFRSVRQWDASEHPPAAARIAGLLSLLFWVGVIVCGRWVGFVT